MSKVAEKGKDEESDYRAPVPGDHVVCLHQGWAYFMATVVSFDETTLKYTVDWDDGDPSGRVQSYQVSRLNILQTLLKAAVEGITATNVSKDRNCKHEVFFLWARL